VKYTGRLSLVAIVAFSGVLFKINAYLTLGYIPLMEWILNAIFIYPAWWCGLQYDKAKYYAKELKIKESEVNRLLTKQLEETEQRFKSLFIHNSEPIFTLNLDGKIIDANEAAVNLLGFTLEEMQTIGWDTIIDEKDFDKHKEYYKNVNEGNSQKFTISMIRRDGRKREVMITIIPIITDNKFTGVYEIAKDITDSKITEEMIRRSDKLSVVGQLAAGVAHEIRNPLTTLRGFVQLFSSDINKEHGTIMLAELDRINFIVSEFLILAKPQVIKYQLKDLNSILADMISLFESQANFKNIKISSTFDLDIPSIKCEQNQLKQVFMNLLKNAIEAMPNGGEIIVNTKQTTPETVCISVIDHGIGIPEDQIKRLGEPFYTTKEDGTGLGLMVCYKIIENHGGKLGISSQLNKGTVVEVSLPINNSL
jgi:PAS domain S-box-containing protein